MGCVSQPKRMPRLRLPSHAPRPHPKENKMWSCLQGALLHHNLKAWDWQVAHGHQSPTDIMCQLKLKENTPGVPWSQGEWTTVNINKAEGTQVTRVEARGQGARWVG